MKITDRIHEPKSILEMIHEKATELAENTFATYMLAEDYGSYIWIWWDGTHTFHSCNTRPGKDCDLIAMIRIPGLYQGDSSVYTEGDWLVWNDEEDSWLHHDEDGNEYYIAKGDGEKMDFEEMVARCLAEGDWTDYISEYAEGIEKDILENLSYDDSYYLESTDHDGTYYVEIWDMWIDEYDIAEIKQKTKKELKI